MIFYVNGSIISIKRVGDGFMEKYKNMPRMFLRLDQEEWKAGYKDGKSTSEPCCKAKSKAYYAGYIAGQKSKEEGDN